MFKLVNESGSVTVYAVNASERDRFIRGGYRLVEEPENGTDLSGLTVAELEVYAKDRGVDLSGCANKAEKLARIKEKESCQ